ncbi:hypothetical protein EDB80DRAFT_810447 [Ilyonectria destructans]|nr:hypothetical protein EDB80DRAFT_810447 [Ilyonectria destructans]
MGTYIPANVVHPHLIDLIRRHTVVPEGNLDDLSDGELAKAIGLALSHADKYEQNLILPLIMSDEEVAVQGLQHPDVQDMDLQIPLTAGERLAALRRTPVPDARDELAPKNVGTCFICFGPGQMTIPGSCKCVFCFPCLRETIRTGLRSELDFPPRCCTPFLEPAIRSANRPALIHLSRQLASEVAVPPAERLYCHHGECAMYIRPEAYGECLSCGSRTCETCRGPAHEPPEQCSDGADGPAEDV